MKADLYPLQVLLLTVSGWVNRYQADVIAYLVEENRVLKEQMKGRRLRLTDDPRRRLASRPQELALWASASCRNEYPCECRHRHKNIMAVPSYFSHFLISGNSLFFH